MYKYMKDRIEEGEAPPKKFHSEMNILIKDLASKQQNVNITLKDELSNTKEFSRGNEQIPLEIVGKFTLDIFKKHIKLTELISKLKTAGLTEADVDIYLNLDNNIHKNLNNDVRQARLEKIGKMIKDHEKSLESIDVPSDNMLLFTPQNLENKLLHFFLKNRCPNSETHLMDEIKNLSNQITNSNSLEEPNISISQIRRKARKLKRRLINKNDKKTIQNVSTKVRNKSKWDVEDVQELLNVVKKKEVKVYTCKPTNYYTIKEGVITKIESEPPENSFKKIKVEEIKQISHFKNYTPGEPCKKLYLKNLAKSISEENLKQIFKKYIPSSDDSITIKLMKGQMRGQAFIEFPSIEQATEALNKVNGIIVKNKPIILSYAKPKSPNKT